MEKRQFHTLDGLRGIAALVMVGRHSPDRTIDLIFPGAYLAVDLFFVLSGFVLAYNYLPRFQHGLSLAGFMRSRVIRLYPLYALATVIGIACALSRPDYPHRELARWIGSILASLLFLPVARSISIDDTTVLPFDNPAWSLSFELLANAVLALVALRLTMRSLIAACLLFALLLLQIGMQIGSLDAGFHPHDLHAGLARVLFSFFAGVLIHAAHARGRLRFGIHPVVPLVAMLLVFAAPAGGEARLIRDCLAALVLLPLIVICAINSDPGPRLARVFAVIGLASYGVYVLHPPLYGALDLLVPGGSAQFGIWATFIVMATAFAATLLLDRCYDRPTRAWLQSLMPPARPSRPGERQDGRQVAMVD